jgi:class 3 adenylate cyclase
MSIRIYIIISYLTLILLLTVGMGAIADRFLGEYSGRSLIMSDAAVKNVTAANTKFSEQILSQVGEYVIKDKAEDVARELSHILSGRQKYDYSQMRRDKNLRNIVLQKIYTPHGIAGYTDLYDNKGEIIFHPDKRAEGQNQLHWRGGYQEATDLLQRSLREDVSGYFTSFDENEKDRRRYSARIHVPGTPFIVSAVVNIDEFFGPTKAKIEQANGGIMAAAKEEIRQYYSNTKRQIIFGGLIAGTVLSCLGVLTGFWFAGIISRPLSRLRNGVTKMGAGDLAVTVPETGSSEIKELAQSFNQLGRQLTDYIAKRDFIRDTFGRYVTQAVVNQLMESADGLKLGGENRELSILMSDLRGFTALTSDMNPERVITFLNRYLSKMIEILLEHRAVIDEIIGDGILAFFGAPEPMEDHPHTAVACALKMQAAMVEINALNETDGLPHLEMGIAVNTGNAVVGNIGSEKRTKYGAVGAQVNFTGRMESFSVGGQVLISPSTFKRVSDVVEVDHGFEVQMKGVPGTITLYDIQGMSGPYRIRLVKNRDCLTLLPEPLAARLYRIKDKIVAGKTQRVWITHLCPSEAILICDGELAQWEDVHLDLLHENGMEIPGKIFGKIMELKPAGDQRQQASLRFTYVAPEIYQIIRQAVRPSSIGV